MKAGNAALFLHPSPRKSGKWWRVRCPAHGGDGFNLALADAERGGLLLTCQSCTCTNREIVEAIERLKPNLFGTGRGTSARGSLTAKRRRCGPVMP